MDFTKKNTMKKIDNIRSILLLIIVLSLSSCSNNLIYFDKENQSINRCNGEPIISIMFRCENDLSLYLFRLKSEKEGTSMFSLKKANENYELKDEMRLLDINSFKLKANAQYTVRHSSNGDAGSGHLILRTDSNGIAVYSDVTSCP